MENFQKAKLLWQIILHITKLFDYFYCTNKYLRRTAVFYYRFYGFIWTYIYVHEMGKDISILYNRQFFILCEQFIFHLLL